MNVIKLQVVVNGVVIHEQDKKTAMMDARYLIQNFKINDLQASGIEAGVYKIVQSRMHLIDINMPCWFDNLIPKKEDYENIYIS